MTKTSEAGKFLKRLEDRSEAEKAQLVWFMTLVAMLGVLALWSATSYRRLNLLLNSNDGAAVAQLAETAGLDELGLGRQLEEGKNLLDRVEKFNEETLRMSGDEFIRQNRLLPEDGFSALELTEARWEDGAAVLNYGQIYKGVPVFGAGLVLRLMPESGAVAVVKDDVARGLDLSTDPALSAKEAGAIALRELADEDYALEAAKLAVVRTSAGDFLIWETELVDATGAQQTIWVGAQRGSVVTPDENQLSNITR